MSVTSSSRIPLFINLWRHAWSCANLDWNIQGEVNPLTGDATNYQRTVDLANLREHDPSLTVWGTISTLYQSAIYARTYRNLHIGENYYVCVSVLIRTWLTAILLYGTNLAEGQNLFLIISPYLKEQPNEIDNLAKEFTEEIEQVCKLISSLGHIKNILEEKYSRNNYAIQLITKIQNLAGKKIIIKNHTVGIVELEIDAEYKTKINSAPSGIELEIDNEYLSKIIGLFINNTEPYINQRETNSKNIELEVKQKPIEIEEVDSSKINIKAFVLGSDITKFFKSIYNAINNDDESIYPNEFKSKLQEKPILNIVSHNNVLQKLIKEQYNVTKSDNPKFAHLQHDNTWGIEMIGLTFDYASKTIQYPNIIKLKEGMRIPYPEHGHLSGVTERDGRTPVLQLSKEFNCNNKDEYITNRTLKLEDAKQKVNEIIKSVTDQEGVAGGSRRKRKRRPTQRKKRSTRRKQYSIRRKRYFYFNN
jgi:hypothetical protein